MTTANILNVSSVKANANVQAESSKKLQEENLEAASVFSALMNQQSDYTDTVLGLESDNSQVTKTESVTTASDSYERYNYKDNRIETVEGNETVEVTEEVADEVQKLEEEVIEAISEEYGVDKETILSVLEQKGLSVLDLLDAQNLASFVMELTGLSSTEAVLFDESFLDLMETLNHLKTGLMKELELTPTEFDELVAQMDAVISDNAETVEMEEVKPLEVQQESTQNVSSEENPSVQTEVENTVSTVENENVATQEVTQGTEEATDSVENLAEKQKETEDSKKVETKTEENADSVEQKDVSAIKTKTETSAEEQEKTPFSNTNSNESMVMNHHSQVANNANADVPKMQTSIYTSVEPMQIIEQIAEQVRVFTNADTTTMEMQLNPENLGKIYLHISSEEGVVNAHFTATNEVVKEALETQLATLRENLTQAGVKVDAIEVTIASHEFEQNLEQNHRQTEEDFEQKEMAEGRRRDLRIDSLDELSGLMTEEETLVAQIMKENGNSVDLTA